jgi:hypothetical protein
MAIEPDPLTVTAPVEELADWVEMRTFRDLDGNGSHVDLLTALRISSTADALAEEESEYPAEPGGDPYEAAVENAFTEIEDRFRACGAESGAYPFALEPDYIAKIKDTSSSVYTFLLLLSRFGDRAGLKPNKAAKLFEEVCARAAEAYLGGAHDKVKSRAFGFPRRYLPGGFKPALQLLCDELQEGLGPRERSGLSDQKDAKLDIVAWRDFGDGRQGKLIAFGQCATGKNWNDKLSELQPADWCGYWLQDRPAVQPVRMFFVPHRVSRSNWLRSCVFGGIFFDRCRIASHSSLIDEQLRTQLSEWSGFVLGKIGAK